MRSRRAGDLTGWRAGVLLAVVFVAPSAPAADRMILRDATLIRIPVASLDADGIVLSSERPGGTSKLVTWDEVEKIALDDEKKQTSAEKLLHDVGEPLFRLRTRLETGDDEGLLAPAEALYPLFAERRSPAALLVLQSLIWGRIAHGQREGAVEPWLREFELLRSRAVKLSDLPGSRKPHVDASSALLAELEPVWFEAAAAKAALPAAEKALMAMAEPLPPGAGLYVASLALAAGDVAKANSYLESNIAGDNVAQPLQQILLAQQELKGAQAVGAAERLRKVVAELERDDAANEVGRQFLHPLALYWLGKAQLAGGTDAVKQDGALTLLRIPALEGRISPELSAAALAEVAQYFAKDAPLAARLRSEIQQQFPSTWHARQLRSK